MSEQFCHEVGIPIGSSPGDLIEFMRVSPVDILDGLLTGDDARDAALASLDEMSQFHLRIVPQKGIPQEKYCQIHLDERPGPVRVALLKDTESAPFPTDMENLLFWAIVQPQSRLAVKWQDKGSGKQLQWREAARGLAIVAEPVPLKDDVGRTVASLLGLEDGSMVASSVSDSMAHSALEIRVGAPVRTLSPIQARLCFEAAVTNHPKWRFLSFYRILEHAYLTNIKHVLMSEFDEDAGQAVDGAKKKLQSEVNQLIDLMVEKDLTHQFIDFSQAFDQQIAARNRYVIAIDRAARNDGLYRDRDASKKAVLLFYKMRCSIAHGGTSSVIYEQTPDAGAAMVSLLPYVESIALKSLAITVL